MVSIAGPAPSRAAAGQVAEQLGVRLIDVTAGPDAVAESLRYALSSDERTRRALTAIVTEAGNGPRPGHPGTDKVLDARHT